jgi:hypothetical protein
MREEMLKRLDEFVDTTCARCEGEYDFDDLRDAWAALHAELAAERCENCTHSRKVLVAGTLLFRCNDTCDRCVKPDFCCSHFEKKEPTS